MRMLNFLYLNFNDNPTGTDIRMDRITDRPAGATNLLRIYDATNRLLLRSKRKNNYDDTTGTIIRK